jgi:hypothetical protein
MLLHTFRLQFSVNITGKSKNSCDSLHCPDLDPNRNEVWLYVYWSRTRRNSRSLVVPIRTGASQFDVREDLLSRVCLYVCVLATLVQTSLVLFAHWKRLSWPRDIAANAWRLGFVYWLCRRVCLVLIIGKFCLLHVPASFKICWSRHLKCWAPCGSSSFSVVVILFRILMKGTV